MHAVATMLATGEPDHVPLYVPILFTAWAVVCWYTGFNRLVRDPRAEFQRIAEVRARRRVLHPFGGGDAESEFERQWRLRWLVPVVLVGYCAIVVWFYVLALTR